MPKIEPETQAAMHRTAFLKLNDVLRGMSRGEALKLLGEYAGGVISQCAPHSMPAELIHIEAVTYGKTSCVLLPGQ